VTRLCLGWSRRVIDPNEIKPNRSMSEVIMKQGIVSSPIQHSVLIISSMADAAGFAASLGSTLECAVSVAPNYRSGLMALRHHEYSVVVVDDCLAESNPAAADLLWQSFGMAVPVQVNFAIAGAPRLTREVQAAIGRREQQQAVALRAAVSQLEGELKSTVTGLLLQSQLALAEPELTAKLTGKLTLVAELAGSLRQRLEGSLGKTTPPLVMN
jgi:hypothetical protein